MRWYFVKRSGNVSEAAAYRQRRRLERLPAPVTALRVRSVPRESRGASWRSSLSSSGRRRRSSPSMSFTRGAMRHGSSSASERMGPQMPFALMLSASVLWHDVSVRRDRATGRRQHERKPRRRRRVDEGPIGRPKNVHYILSANTFLFRSRTRALSLSRRCSAVRPFPGSPTVDGGEEGGAGGETGGSDERTRRRRRQRVSSLAARSKLSRYSRLGIVLHRRRDGSVSRAA
jgi:hypothetical protein